MHPPTVRAYGARNTLRALEELAVAPLSAPELAARLAVSDPTARRILQRLRTEGYAARGDWHHRRYSATLRLAALARSLLDHSPLLHLAGPTLLALAEGGEATLWVPGGADTVLCVLRCPPGASEAQRMLGAPVPSRSCAAGLALAAADAGAGVVVARREPPALAAPVVDQGDVVAALALAPAFEAADRERVARAASTINALLRDGVV
ncbi:MAG TPA: MarR family transcriptional regulator [Baekduia sp.]